MLVIFHDVKLCSNINHNNERYVSAKIKTKNAGFRILLYGMPSEIIYERTRKMVGKKYRIDFINVAGCQISRELKDSVELVNEKVDAILYKRYGDDFWEKFTQEMEIEKPKLIMCNQLLNKQNELIKLKNKLYNGHDNIYCEYEKKNDSIYIEKIGDWIEVRHEYEYINYYLYSINIHSKKIELIHKNINI
jgi:hypothetical protein